ncbi:MAG: hypothetical protein JW751_02490 [Polyangiaceae bacterium]|nr:hypothetical protein [Polyangiaceae bacterium]
MARTVEATGGSAGEQPRGANARRSPFATTSGVLLASVAVPVIVLDGAVGGPTEAPPILLVTTAAISLLLLLAGLLITRLPRGGQVAATLAMVGGLGLGAPRLVERPLVCLAVLVAGTAGLVSLWNVGAPLLTLARTRVRPQLEGRAQGAAIQSILLWLLWVFADMDRSALDTLVVGSSLVVSAVLGIAWSVGGWRAHRGRALGLLAALVTAGAVAVPLWGQWWWTMSGLLPVAVSISVLTRGRPRSGVQQASWWEPLLGRPERLFVGTFAGLSIGGAFLLALPQSSASGHSIGLLDALFTSTSAVCVTGLVVLDTSADFDGFGQAVILLLIQVGGLGIMTFSTTALWALGRRMSLRHEGAVASLISAQDRGHLFATARRILALTALAEAVGALLLTAAFVRHGDRLLTALWRGGFTSVSAFCNAGFALQSDSLVPYQHSPFVLHVVGLLIILGGLSPAAVLAVPALVQRRPAPVAAQAKLCLVAAAVLLGLGFLFVLAFEWQGSLAGLPFADRVHNAWFQSVTLRTAGFNSIDLGAMRPPTFTLMLLWMFIGGSPGGTAGGVKTTTVTVLLLSVVHAIRGRSTLEVFGRRIPERTHSKAAMTVTVAATAAIFALLALELTQRMPTRLAAFEVVSALGTVGLSIGGTGALDGVGKAIITVCMFVGRVGGLTLLMFLSSRGSVPALGRPEEEIDVG